MKKLKYKKFTGLHIVCKKCNKNIEVSSVPYRGCVHPIDKQKYKAIVKINGIRKTRDLKATEYDEAVKELLRFKEDLANPINITSMLPEIKYELLVDFIMMYSDWLENINVPKYEQKIRTPKYIRETIGYLLKLAQFLKDKGHDLEKLTIYQVNKFMLGDYYEHLKQTIKSPSTFNHNLRAIKNFYNFLVYEKELIILNIPKKMKLLYESPNPTTIADEDFLLLLSKINPEDSIQTLKNGVKKNRFRPYTKDGIELCAYTGMRLEEVTSLKYSDIIMSADRKLDYVIGTDLKFQRAHNSDSTKAVKTVYIPVSPELENLLKRLNYQENIGLDKYLIAGDENITRSSLAKQLSHSFTFYRRQAGLEDGISIKHLRKTFLTKLHLQTGLTESMGYQKTASVVLKNYIDKTAVAREVKRRNFSFFRTVGN
ncbi:tyrosine-type recombinase/integrase [Flavobacterium lindanitolerans]|jgi:integrase|uniref:tyrosine-type recombinase/integrase n=1 Tax=Flavobacterium lindanitolerans TaxID=428988 RepID=UPI0023F4B935|nr:tyrosine-type recombinase/integrase [Flavobacterium lindanitolerans]